MPDIAKRKISQAERKRLAREGKAVVNPDGHISYPIANAEDLGTAAALARSGHGDVEAARKLIRRRAKELGVANPLESSQKGVMGNVPAGYGRDLTQARVSPSRVSGNQAPAVDDHGTRGMDPMAQPGPRELAFRHQDLRQSNVRFNDVIANLQTVNGDDQNGDRSITYTPGQVALSMFNAAGQSGSYPGMQPVNPMPHRPDYGIARTNAVGEGTGRNTLDDPQSHAVAMKASDRRELMKRHNFPGSGGGR